MGPVAQSNGDVIFCLAAPQKSSVLLVPSWDDYQTLDKNVMSYQDYNGYRYFWIKVSGLDPDKQYPYYFIVDGNIKVGDPYAKLVLDCHSDKWLPDNVYPTRPRYPYDKMDGTMLAVYHGNQDNYNWKVQNFDIPDPSKLIIYEMLFRDFTGDGEDNSEEGKQLGTIRGAIDKFQYFLDLGVNAIELMPVMEFNGNNSWGYNTNFYMALDKAYGSPDRPQGVYRPLPPARYRRASRHRVQPERRPPSMVPDVQRIGQPVLQRHRSPQLERTQRLEAGKSPRAAAVERRHRVLDDQV